MSGIVDRLSDLLDKELRPEGHPRVMGVYSDPDKCAEAIKSLRDNGYTRLVSHRPIPSHDIEEAMGNRPSMVRYFSLAGALLGAVGGFILCVWASRQWNLITGGKPIISVPPFLIITFESAILLGGLGTLLGFLHTARIPQPKLSETYIERFGEDRFGVGVVCDEADVERAEGILERSGAEEVFRAPA